MNPLSFIFIVSVSFKKATLVLKALIVVIIA